MTVLVVGATGSIGHLVVEEVLRHGHIVRALVWNPRKPRQLPSEAQVVIGDVTRPETLPQAVDGVDAIVFTIGPYIALVGLLGAGALILWLLVFGVNEQRWKEQVRAAGTGV